MKGRIERDPLLLEGGFEFLQGGFEATRDVHRVGAVLTGHGHEHAGMAHDDGVTELWFGAFNDAAQVFETHAHAVGVYHDDLCQLGRRYSLAFSLNDDALVLGFDVASTHHAGGGAGGAEEAGKGGV